MEAQGALWVTTIICCFIEASNMFKWIPCWTHVTSAAFLKLHQIRSSVIQRRKKKWLILYEALVSIADTKNRDGGEKCGATGSLSQAIRRCESCVKTPDLTYSTALKAHKL